MVEVSTSGLSINLTATPVPPFEGGVKLYELPPRRIPEVETQNHIYTIVHKVLGKVLISGHPEF